MAGNTKNHEEQYHEYRRLVEKRGTYGERLHEYREYRARFAFKVHGPPSVHNKLLKIQAPIAEFTVEHAVDKGFHSEWYSSPSDCIDCPVCDRQFDPRQEYDNLAYSDSISDADAQQCIRALITSIDENWTSLRNKLESHGDNLLKRWPKLGENPMQARFGKLGMEQTAWPQLQRYYYYDWGWHEKRQYRNAFLTPQLNAEALAKSAPRFLRLVYNRTEYIPADFFWDDLRTLDFPLSQGLVDKIFNASCVITDGELRGTLVPWDRERMHREEICSFPLTKIVLEAQDLLMRTMLLVVEETLGDLKQGSGNRKWTEAAQADFCETSRTSMMFEISYPALEHPYGPPQRFRLSELLDLVTLRLETLSDSLKDLQTDPPFMQATILGLPHASQILEAKTASSEDTRHFWYQASRNIWLCEYARAVGWAEIKQYISAVHNATSSVDLKPGESFESLIPLGRDLPKEYASALLSLYEACISTYPVWTMGPARQCLQNFPGVTKPLAEGQSVVVEDCVQEDFDTHSCRRILYTKDRLLWALLELFNPIEKYDPRFAIETGLVLGVLAEEMTNAKQRARLDAKSCLAIDDLMALYLIWAALTSHRPAFPRPKGFHFIHTNTGGVEAAKSRHGAKILDATHDFWISHEEESKATCFALKKVYETKWPRGRPNKASLEKVTKARVALGDFWYLWRGIMRTAINDVWPDVYDTHSGPMTDLLQFDLQDEYKERINEEILAAQGQPGEPARKRKATIQTTRHAEPVEYIPHSTTPAAKEKIEPPQKKQKQKTTGTPVPQPEAEPQEQELPPSPVSPELPKILVSKKSFEVLERLFPNDSGNHKEGTMRWQDVESVLTEAGLAMEQGQGSAVTFKQEADENKRASRFSLHRPHRQGDNVDANILRRIGYRLKDRLGWKWKQFEVKKGR